MPALMSDARIKEKFQDQEYLDNVEHMFREKFIENLGVSSLSEKCAKIQIRTPTFCRKFQACETNSIKFQFEIQVKLAIKS